MSPSCLPEPPLLILSPSPPACCATTTAANGTAAPPAPAPLSLSLAFIDCCSRHWPIPRQGRLSCLFAHHSLTYGDQ
ncbi:hypothetical protein SDJN02_08995, partial [Cucurbita argyrosperma subsp. argyrosperma]